MKAVAAFPDRKSINLIDTEPPEITAPTQAKVRILEVGVCGTDKEIASFEYGTPPAGSEYLIIGHESLGEVVETGPEVKGISKGDLVVTMVRRPCQHPECMACRAGRQDFCYTGDFTERGIKEQHGFLTDYIVDEAQYMVPAPADLRDIAVLTEPLTIAEKGIAQAWEVQQRLPWACAAEPGQSRGYCHRAVVLGAGPVGLLGAMVLASQGFETHVYSRQKAPNEKADLAQAIGAQYVSSEEESIDKFAARIGNIDLVYEATGASQVAFDTIRVLGANSVFIFTGVPGRKAPVAVDTDLIMRQMVLKNQMVFGTVNADRKAFESAIQDLRLFKEKWPQAVTGLISKRYAMEEYQDLLLGKAGGIKNVISIAA